MTTQFTPILQLALPVTGELNGTWGDVVNDNITSMVEEAIAGAATINTWAGSPPAHTLTTANGTTDEARCAMLICSGTPGAAAQVICPTRTKLYVVTNNVAGGYAVTIKTAAGTGVSVANGTSMLVYCNGTNVVEGVSNTGVSSFSAGTTGLTPNTSTTGAITLGGTLAIANGGTNSTATPTDGGIAYGDGTSYQFTSAGTSGGVLYSAGTGVPGFTAAGTAGQVLSSNGSSAPTWIDAPNPAKAGGAIVVNNTTASVSYTIDAGTNGFSVGPITVASGVTVTVASGQRWVVI
jgi:hypothetical protein